MQSEDIPVNIQPSATVQDLKNDIHALTETPESVMKLNFGGRQLQDGRSLSEYNVQNNSSIFMVLFLRGGGKSMFFLHVIRENSDQLLISMAVDSDYEIVQIKRKLMLFARVPLPRVRLLVKGREMRDQNTLASYGIEDECCVHLGERQENAVTRVIAQVQNSCVMS